MKNFYQRYVREKNIVGGKKHENDYMDSLSLAINDVSDMIYNVSHVDNIKSVVYNTEVSEEEVKNALSIDKIISIKKKLIEAYNVIFDKYKLDNLNGEIITKISATHILYLGSLRVSVVEDEKADNIFYISPTEFTSTNGQNSTTIDDIKKNVGDCIDVDKILEKLREQEKVNDKKYILQNELLIDGILSKNVSDYCPADIFYLTRKLKRLLQDGTTTFMNNYRVDNKKVYHGNLEYIDYLLKVHEKLVGYVKSQLPVLGLDPEKFKLLFKGGNVHKYYFNCKKDGDVYKYSGAFNDYLSDLSDFDFDVVYDDGVVEKFHKKYENNIIKFQTNLQRTTDNNLEFCEDNSDDLIGHRLVIEKIYGIIKEFFTNYKNESDKFVMEPNIYKNIVGHYKYLQHLTKGLINLKIIQKHIEVTPVENRNVPYFGEYYCDCNKEQKMSVYEIVQYTYMGKKLFIKNVALENISDKYDFDTDDLDEMRNSVKNTYDSKSRNCMSYVSVTGVGGCRVVKDVDMYDMFGLARTNIRFFMTLKLNNKTFVKVTSKTEVYDYGDMYPNGYQGIVTPHDSKKMYPKLDMSIGNSMHVVPSKSVEFIIKELIMLYMVVKDLKSIKRYDRMLKILSNYLKITERSNVEAFMNVHFYFLTTIYNLRFSLYEKAVGSTMLSNLDKNPQIYNLLDAMIVDRLLLKPEFDGDYKKMMEQHSEINSKIDECIRNNKHLEINVVNNLGEQYVIRSKNTANVLKQRFIS